MKKIVALVLSLVMVLGLATTAFAAGTQLYMQDSGSTANETTWNEIGDELAGVPADYLVEADYTYGDEGWLEHYYITGQGYFVEAPKAAAQYKLACGNVVIYMNKVTDLADVFYKYEADVFTALTTEDDACGNLEVSKKNLAKTFYVVENEKGIPVFYFQKVATLGADDLVLLVDDKLVYATDVTESFIEHVWVGNDVDPVTKAYTTAICDNCGKVATLYANADAAGKYSEFKAGLGWITAAAAGYDAPVVEAPETDKVESAETFDAGIAMYVGMSVMAAAGSAVVLKKKD